MWDFVGSMGTKALGWGKSIVNSFIKGITDSLKAGKKQSQMHLASLVNTLNLIHHQKKDLYRILTNGEQV